jgi:hypothetical protein
MRGRWRTRTSPPRTRPDRLFGAPLWSSLRDMRPSPRRSQPRAFEARFIGSWSLAFVNVTFRVPARDQRRSPALPRPGHLRPPSGAGSEPRERESFDRLEHPLCGRPARPSRSDFPPSVLTVRRHQVAEANDRRLRSNVVRVATRSERQRWRLDPSLGPGTLVGNG